MSLFVNATLMAALTDAERRLVAETEPDALAALDEDAAIALETRIRRARNKYTGQYRRTASARVPRQGGRGMARPMNTQAATKAEAFEQALARVSRRVGVLARQSAAELRARRLAMARAARQNAPGRNAAGRNAAGRNRAPSGAHGRRDASGPAPARKPKSHRALRTPATEKARAGTKAMGARRQARRDSKG